MHLLNILRIKFNVTDRAGQKLHTICKIRYSLNLLLFQKKVVLKHDPIRAALFVVVFVFVKY